MKSLSSSGGHANMAIQHSETQFRYHCPEFILLHKHTWLQIWLNDSNRSTYRKAGKCNQIQKILGKLIFSVRTGFKKIMMSGVLAKQPLLTEKIQGDLNNTATVPVNHGFIC